MNGAISEEETEPSSSVNSEIKIVCLRQGTNPAEGTSSSGDVFPSSSQSIVDIKEEDEEQHVDIDMILDELESYPDSSIDVPSISGTYSVNNNNTGENISISDPTILSGPVSVSQTQVTSDNVMVTSRRESMNQNSMQSDDDTNKVSSTTHNFELEYNSYNQDLIYPPVVPVKKKIQKYMCKHCDFVTEKYSSIYSHFKRLHPRLSKAKSLLKHYNKTIAVPTKKAIPTLYACQHCNYITLSMGGFMTHSSRKHPRRKVNPIKQGSPITTSVNRKYLEALYMSQEEPLKDKRKIQELLLTYHKDSKVVQKPPQYVSTSCIICERDFKTSILLGKHYEVCHSQQGPKKNHITGLYHCKLCIHETLTRMELYKHYSQMHIMDAFYAWNVPSLEPSLLEQDRKCKIDKVQTSGTKRLVQYKKDGSMEQLDIFMPSSVQWNIDHATNEQLSESRIPCIVCDFSSTNLVELLLHYHTHHEERYPKGLKAALFDSLMRHVIVVHVPQADLHLVDPVDGVLLNESSEVVQFFKYKCQLCTFHGEYFQCIINHFTAEHPFLDECVNYVVRTISQDVSQKYSKVFSECIKCGYISHLSSHDILHHCKQKHLMTSTDTAVLTHPIVEHRACMQCTFVGNVDNMQWHYAKVHNHYEMIWHDLKLASSSFNPKTFECCICSFTSDKAVDLASHYVEKHFENAMTFTTPTEDDLYQCIRCKAITRTLGGMIKHHYKHENAEGDDLDDSNEKNSSTQDQTSRYLSCKHCRKVFLESPYLWSHITQEHHPISQLLCISDLPLHFIKYGFWDDEVFKKHRSARKSSAGSSKQPFENVDLDSTLHNEQSTLVHGSKNGSFHASTSETSDRLLCKFCHYETYHHASMSKHLTSTHHHDLTFRCFKCDKEFPAILDCVKHHLYIHGLRISRPTAYNMLLNDIIMMSKSRKKFMCAWCGYKAFSRPLVLNHFNSRHVSDKSLLKTLAKKDQYYSCRWCDYCTRNATSMRSHASGKHNRPISYYSLQNFRIVESDSPFSSNSSDDEYLPSSNMRNHKSYFSSKAKFFLIKTCDINNDSDFSDSSIYKSTHERCKHQVRYPYSCRFCRSAFSCATAYLKHCIREHDLWCSVSNTTKSVHVLADTSVLRKRQYEQDALDTLDWFCDLCNMRFSTSLQLQEHVVLSHNGKTIYECVHCRFTSFDEKKVLLHLYKHLQSTESSKSQVSLEESKEDFSLINSTNEEQYRKNSDVVSDTCIEIVSDDSDYDISALSPVESTSVSNNDTMLQSKARKSIRGNNASDVTEVEQDWQSRAIESVRVYQFKDDSSSSDECDFNGQYSEISRDVDELEIIDGNNHNLHFDHSVAHDSLLRCDKCEFYCTDSERMAAHVKSTHMSAKDFACKFCSFVSDNFINLDVHLVEFHKIERNHQLGLQMRFSMEEGLVTSEAAVQAIAEMKSRFLYTPTPCLPILREEVTYIENDSDAPSTSERFKCSYCGHAETSTFKLEMHMRRHEGNFQQSDGDIDRMNYEMNKIGIVYNFP